MNFDKLRYFIFLKKNEFSSLITLSIAVWYYSRTITTHTLQESLPFLFLPFILIIIIFDIHFGIILWYVLSTTANIFCIDLPGLPPLHIAQLILLLLLCTWFIKSYKEIPLAVGRFMDVGRNRVFLALFGWITLSMVIGRITDVTQMNFKYQFNAWLSIVFVILTALLLSCHFNRCFLKKIIWTIICTSTSLQILILVSGILHGVGLFGWQNFIQEMNLRCGFVIPSSVFIALFLFSQQKFFGKVLLSVVIIISIIYSALLIISGHRTTLFSLCGALGFILFLIKPRLLAKLSLVVLPIALLNISTIQSWLNEQTGYVITSQRVASGEGSRIALAKDAFEIIKKHPVWGTGTDFYRLHSELQIIYPGGAVDAVPTPHNGWLQVGVDHGIPAFFLLAIFCWYILRDCKRLFNYLNDRFSKLFVLFFFSTLGESTIGSFISSGMILPVFTGSYQDEPRSLAGVLFSFWFLYGIFLGIENEKAKINSAVTAPELA